MSKPRYKWWGYVRRMVRDYPARAGRDDLDQYEAREVEAVRLALEDIAAKPDGAARLQQIELYHFRGAYDLDGASAAAHTSKPTGRRWNAQFLRLVAVHFGLVGDNDE